MNEGELNQGGLPPDEPHAVAFERSPQVRIIGFDWKQIGSTSGVFRRSEK